MPDSGFALGASCDCTCGPTFKKCGTGPGCDIPANNLTISWTNIITGNGSAALVYNAMGGVWRSGCTGGGTNQLVFQLGCNAGVPELRAFYPITGACVGGVFTGFTNFCSNVAGGAGTLTQTSLTCGAGYTQVFTVTLCASLSASGYTSFTVSP